MKRAKNDGYVLPMTIALIVIMGILTVSCLTMAEHNYRAEMASIRRTQALYDAEGKMERLRLRLIGRDGFTTQADAQGVPERVADVYSEDGSVKVSATFRLTAKEYSDEEGGDPQEYWHITGAEYDSYSITEVSEEGGAS